MSPKRTVAVDLDGTLARFDSWEGVEHFGDPLPGAVEFTKKLSEFARVVIWTTRLSSELDASIPISQRLALVRNWLDEHGFSYHSIFVGTTKPVAAAFVDDRAIPADGDFDRMLRQCRALTGDGHQP